MLKDKKMLRSIALLLCLSLIIGIVPLGILSVPVEVNAVPGEDGAEQTNLLTNGTFDAGTDGWGGINAAKTVVVDNAMRIVTDGTSACLNQTIEVAAGEKYTLTLKFKAESVDRSPFVGLWFFKDTTSNANCINVSKIDITDRSGDWIEVKVSGIVPEGANLLQVQLGNNSGLTGTYWFDDVVLTKNLVSVVFTDNFTTYAVEGAAGSGPKNWILSETDAGNHSNITCNQYSQLSGRPGMTLQGKAATAQTPSFEVTAGNSYTAEFASMKFGAKYGGYVVLAFENASGAVVGSQRKNISTESGWVNDSLTAIAPQGAVKGYVIFGITENGDDYAVNGLVVTATGAAAVEPTNPTEATEATEATEPAGDLPLNGNFEASDSEYTNWYASKNTKAPTVVPGMGRNDSNALFFNNTGAGMTEFFSDMFAIDAGKSYTLSVWTRLDEAVEPDTRFNMFVHWYDADGNQIDASGAGAINSTTQWAAHTATVEPLDGAAYAAIRFYIGNNRKLVAYVDDITFTANVSTPAEPTETTEPTSATEATVPMEGTVIFADDFSIFAVEDAVGSGPKDWLLSETDTGGNTAITCKPYHGRSELTLQSKAVTAQSPAFQVTAGKAYAVVFEAYKHIAGRQNGGFVKLTFVDANGNVISEQSQAAGNKYGAWATEYIVAIAPANAAKAYVSFGIAANADSFSVADLKVLENDELPEPPATEETEPPTGTEPPHNDALLNGEFEDSDSEIPGWTFTKGSVLPVLLPGEGLDGSNALKFINENRFSEMSSELFAVEGGKYYALSVWTRLDPEYTTNTRFNTFVHWFDQYGNEIQQGGCGSINSANEWVEHTASVAAPSDAAFAKLRFYVSGNNCALASYVDNVTFVVSGDAPDPTEPTVTEPVTEPIDGTPVFSEDFTEFATDGAAGSGPKDWLLSETEAGNHTPITCNPYHSRPEMTLQSKAVTAQSPAFKVVGGKAYVVVFEAYKHIAGRQNGGYVELTFVDASGNVISSQSQAAGNRAGAWAREYLAVIAPANAAKAYVTFGIAANADSFSVAELVVLENDTMPELPDPEDTRPTDGTEPPHNDSLLNGDFEASDSELPGWNIIKGSAVPAIVPGEGIDGSAALKFTNENRMTEMTSELFAITGGKVYDLSVWTRLDPDYTTNTRFNTFVHWYDKYGYEIQQDGAGAINSNNDWTKFVGTVVAPEDAAFVSIRFYVSGNNCTLAAYVDDISFTLSSYTPVDPGVFEVINGDFEKGMANWKGASSEGATNELVTDGAYDGQSVLITANATETAKAVTSFAQTLYLNGATAVHLTAMSKTLTPDSIRGAYVGLWFYDANGKLVPENTAFSIPLGTMTEWTQASLIQAVPEGAVTVKLEFGNNSGKVGMAYLVDNIHIEVYTGPAENIKPATPAEPSTGGSGSGIVDISKLNGSLEELDAYGMPVGWRLLGADVKYTVLQPDDAPDGKNVIQMEKTVQGGNALRSPSVACTPGETYEIKVMVKDIVGTCKISFMVYDINGQRLDTACKSVNSLGTGKWQMYSILAAMPDNAAYMFLEVWGAANSTYTCQVDKLRIQVSDIKTKPPYEPTPYDYPTVEELTENLTDVYPRVFFTPEEAKAIKLRRFDMLKTKYGWTWNSQYESLLENADAALSIKKGDKLLVRANTGKMIYMDYLSDVNSEENRAIYLANSYDDEGNSFEYPYTGFGALVTSQYAGFMKNCALAYIMTGKAKYADRAIEIALAIADWEGWTDEYWVAGHNCAADASHAWMMDGMVAVYDMCHDRMTEDQLKKLERSIIEEGLVPLSQQVDENSLSNGNMMMVGGILSGAAVILSEENAAEVKPYLDRGLLCMHNALDNFAFSGTIEGHYYTDFGLQTLMPGVGHIYRATQMEGIIDHPFLSEILPYWTIMWAANVSGSHPNYSDGSVATYMQVPLGVLSKLTHDPLIDGFLINAGGIGSAFNNLIYLNPDPQPEYLTDYAGVIESFGYGALRTGFADDDMLLVLKANDSQSGHNHYDQNSIQFSIGQNWLITDPGAGSYYYADRSFWTHNGHSTIMVDGNAQMINGLSSTKLVFNNNLYSYIVGSAEKAYGADYDSRMLEKFDRHAIQVNHEDKAYYVIIDDLLSSKDREYTWQMYNGSRGTFSVDDVEVPAKTVAMGNKVSLPMGKHVLNLNFVDGDKLAIGDKVYSGGFCLGATSAATKAHQFMTIISTDSNMLSLDINFYDILNGMRSTVPEHIVEGEISWDSSMPLGQEIIKPNVVGTTSCIFYRGNGLGDWLEIPFVIEEGGNFDFDLIMGVSDGCCQIKATIDGKYVSDVVDCSGLPEAFIEVPFGELELESGVHTVRMEIVGKGLDEDYADGWYLINAAGISMMRVGVEIPPANDVVVTEVIDNAEALAGMLNYKDNKFDFLMWNRTEGAATAGLLNTDAQQASVLGLVDGKITEGFAATAATTLVYDGKVLFLAEKDVDIVASSTGWQIISDEAQTVQLTAVAPELEYAVTVNGEAGELKIENGILTVAVEAGETKIALAVEEPEPEPSEPATEPEETDPTEAPTEAPTVAPTEPVDNNDGNDATLWIIIAAIVVVLAGAAVGIVLFLKKRKTA